MRVWLRLEGFSALMLAAFFYRQTHASWMLFAILSVFVAGLEQTWLTPGDALVLGVAVAVVGPIGDLFESLIKRDAGVKDSGNLFGAHGGALDRLDAVIFTVVAGYYVWVSLPH